MPSFGFCPNLDTIFTTLQVSAKSSGDLPPSTSSTHTQWFLSNLLCACHNNSKPFSILEWEFMIRMHIWFILHSIIRIICVKMIQYFPQFAIFKIVKTEIKLKTMRHSLKILRNWLVGVKQQWQKFCRVDFPYGYFAMTDYVAVYAWQTTWLLGHDRLCGCLSMTDYTAACIDMSDYVAVYAWQTTWLLWHDKLCGCLGMTDYMTALAWQTIWLLRHDRLHDCFGMTNYLYCLGMTYYMTALAWQTMWLFKHDRLHNGFGMTDYVAV